MISYCLKHIHIRSLSGPCFFTFRLNTEIYTVSLRIKFKYGKIWTRKALNTDPFYTVKFDLSLPKIRKLSKVRMMRRFFKSSIVYFVHTAIFLPSKFEFEEDQVKHVEIVNEGEASYNQVFLRRANFIRTSDLRFGLLDFNI